MVLYIFASLLFIAGLSVFFKEKNPTTAKMGRAEHIILSLLALTGSSISVYTSKWYPALLSLFAIWIIYGINERIRQKKAIFGENWRDPSEIEESAFLPEYGRGLASLAFKDLSEKFPAFRENFQPDLHYHKFSFLTMVSVTAVGIQQFLHDHPNYTFTDVIPYQTEYFKNNIESEVKAHVVFTREPGEQSSEHHYFHQAVLNCSKEISSYLNTVRGSTGDLTEEEYEWFTAFSYGSWILTKLGGPSEILQDKELCATLGFLVIEAPDTFSLK